MNIYILRMNRLCGCSILVFISHLHNIALYLFSLFSLTCQQEHLEPDNEWKRLRLQKGGQCKRGEQTIKCISKTQGKDLGIRLYTTLWELKEMSTVIAVALK